MTRNIHNRSFPENKNSVRITAGEAETAQDSHVILNRWTVSPREKYFIRKNDRVDFKRTLLDMIDDNIILLCISSRLTEVTFAAFTTAILHRFLYLRHVLTILTIVIRYNTRIQAENIPIKPHK